MERTDTAHSGNPFLLFSRNVSGSESSSPWDSKRDKRQSLSPFDSPLTSSPEKPSIELPEARALPPGPKERDSKNASRENILTATHSLRDPMTLPTGPARTGTRSEKADHYFGSEQFDEGLPQNGLRQGEEVLLTFLQRTLGARGRDIAARLLNLTPITSKQYFSYVISQTTEDSDIQIILRDLESGALYSQGRRLVAGSWCSLLLGDRFQSGSSKKQRHELTYRRSFCSCIVCRVKIEKAFQAEMEGSGMGNKREGHAHRSSFSSISAAQERTSQNSAKANFVGKTFLPSLQQLNLIGARTAKRDLEIGSLIRLNYRNSARLKFTKEFKDLFGNFAYTGPIAHEQLYRKVTTIGTNYYQFNKGKKERRVYIHGELVTLPVQMGIVKLGSQPTCVDERGATFILYCKQEVSIFVGDIVLEGNSLGSFIHTNIPFYIGFGEEKGASPVFPNKRLGKPRKLGINELLLHHHMVSDLEVNCI